MNSSPQTRNRSPVTTIREIGQHEGQIVTIRGWLYNLRESGKLLFPIFRDGSGIIQGVVAKEAVSPEMFETIKGLTQESSVIVSGKVRADKRAPGGFELDVTDAQVVQRVNETIPIPISLKEHGVDFLMEHRHLWLRSPRQARSCASAPRSSRRARLLRRSRLHPYRSAHPYARRLRRHDHAVSGGLLRGAGVI